MLFDLMMTVNDTQTSPSLSCGDSPLSTTASIIGILTFAYALALGAYAYIARATTSLKQWEKQDQKFHMMLEDKFKFHAILNEMKLTQSVNKDFNVNRLDSLLNKFEDDAEEIEQRFAPITDGKRPLSLSEIFSDCFRDLCSSRIFLVPVDLFFAFKQLWFSAISPVLVETMDKRLKELRKTHQELNRDTYNLQAWYRAVSDTSKHLTY